MMQTIYYDLRNIKGQQKEVRDKINAAAKILREGGLVGIPTETVYGLAANGLDEAAVKRIFEAKGRPQDNPLILHLAGAQWLPRYCADVPPLAYVLARKFWPGPLTMILKRKSEVPDVITAGLDTVAVRCPNHPVTLAIIHQLESTQRSRFISRVIKFYGPKLLTSAVYSVEELAVIAGLSTDQVKRVIHALDGDCLHYQSAFSGRAVTLTDPAQPMPHLNREEIEAKRSAEIARLDEVVTYASAHRCRQATLIDYFGEDVTSWRCGCCDICSGEDGSLRDPTPEEYRAVRIILLAVANFNGRIGAGKLAKVLTGSSEIDSPWLRNSGDFGKLAAWKQNSVAALLHSLERSGALERVDQGGFPCLQLSEQGEDVLTGAADIKLDLSAPRTGAEKERKPRKGKAASAASSGSGNSALYERLRGIRQQMATARDLPLYAVLTNRDLATLVEHLPLTPEEAIKLPGFGEHKAKRILPPFLAEIRKYKEENGPF